MASTIAIEVEDFTGQVRRRAPTVPREARVGELVERLRQTLHLPEVDASGSAARAKQSQNQPFFGALALPPNFPFEYNVYQVGFDASWEIDLFGGRRRGGRE